MLSKAFAANNHLDGLIFHSDQGWQYQMAQYQQILKEHKIVQSMSRKDNCLYNCIMENFFGKMKNEMFYGHEYELKKPECAEGSHGRIYCLLQHGTDPSQMKRPDALRGKEPSLKI